MRRRDGRRQEDEEEREVDERMARMEGRKQEDKEEGVEDRRRRKETSGVAEWTRRGESEGDERRRSRRFCGVSVRCHVSFSWRSGAEARRRGQKTSGVAADADVLCLLETETGRQDQHKLPGFKLNFQSVIGRSV